MRTLSIAFALSLLAAACGGANEPADQGAPEVDAAPDSTQATLDAGPDSAAPAPEAAAPDAAADRPALAPDGGADSAPLTVSPDAGDGAVDGALATRDGAADTGPDATSDAGTELDAIVATTFRNFRCDPASAPPTCGGILGPGGGYAMVVALDCASTGRWALNHTGYDSHGQPVTCHACPVNTLCAP